MIIFKTIVIAAFGVRMLTASLNAATNLGLVGIAELAPDAFDASGETLGACFSGMWWDSNSSTLFAVADRGPSDGHVDYRPRAHEFSLFVNQRGHPSLSLTNRITRLLHDDKDRLFSGHDPGDGPAGARQSIDPEAIVRAPDHSFYISEEYGPYVYHFNADFRMLGLIEPPSNFLPKRAGKIRTTAVGDPESGRTANHGFEGLGITADGTQLWAALQRPLVQDCYRDGKKVPGAHFTRLLTWSLSSPQPRLTGEYVYPLDLEEDETKAGSLSEILVLNDKQFLALEHDSRGLGSLKPGKTLCRVYLASLAGATNLRAIEGTPFSRDAGDPQGHPLDGPTLPSPVQAISKTLLVDLMEPAVLKKAGIRDASQMPEKWEGLALVNDPSLAPGQYLLLVGVDNDFKSHHTFVKTTEQPGGVKLDVAGPSGQEVPTLVFAFQVTLPEYVVPLSQKNSSQTKPTSNGG